MDCTCIFLNASVFFKGMPIQELEMSVPLHFEATKNYFHNLMTTFLELNGYLTSQFKLEHKR